MFQTLKNAWRVPELKSKILFTLLIIVVYRLGSVIPVPFIDADLIAGFDLARIDEIGDLSAAFCGEVAKLENACALKELYKFSLVAFHF